MNYLIEYLDFDTTQTGPLHDPSLNFKLMKAELNTHTHEIISQNFNGPALYDKLSPNGFYQPTWSLTRSWTLIFPVFDIKHLTNSLTIFLFQINKPKGQFEYSINS